MKVESITFLSDLKDVKDIFDDNMDVSVKLENGRNYVLVVGTPKNLLRLMENEKSDFLSPEDPIVIVKKMTKEVIEQAIRTERLGYEFYIQTAKKFEENNSLNTLFATLALRVGGRHGRRIRLGGCHGSCRISSTSCTRLV